MKTITLADEAYNRLRDWKGGERESLSTVVLRVVPKRGTLADLLHSFQQLPTLTDEQAQVMQDAIAWSNDWRHVDGISSLGEVDERVSP